MSVQLQQEIAEFKGRMRNINLSVAHAEAFPHSRSFHLNAGRFENNTLPRLIGDYTLFYNKNLQIIEQTAQKSRKEADLILLLDTHLIHNELHNFADPVSCGQFLPSAERQHDALSSRAFGNLTGLLSDKPAAIRALAGAHYTLLLAVWSHLLRGGKLPQNLASAVPDYRQALFDAQTRAGTPVAPKIFLIRALEHYSRHQNGQAAQCLLQIAQIQSQETAHAPGMTSALNLTGFGEYPYLTGHLPNHFKQFVFTTLYSQM